MLKLLHQLLRFLGFFWQQLDFRNRFGEQGFDFDEDKVGDLGVSRHFLLQSLNLFAHLLNAFLDARRTKFFKLAELLDLRVKSRLVVLQITNLHFVYNCVVFECRHKLINS